MTFNFLLGPEKYLHRCKTIKVAWQTYDCTQAWAVVSPWILSFVALSHVFMPYGVALLSSSFYNCFWPQRVGSNLMKAASRIYISPAATLKLHESTSLQRLPLHLSSQSPPRPSKPQRTSAPLRAPSRPSTPPFLINIHRILIPVCHARPLPRTLLITGLHFHRALLFPPQLLALHRVALHFGYLCF